MKKTIHNTLRAGLCLLLAINTMIGCSGRSTQPPTGPDNPRELVLLYCRTVEVDLRIHLQWAANRATTGQIRYGRNGYTNLITVGTAADSHDVVLPNLAYSTRYVYRLNVRDHQQLQAEFSGEFTTPPKASAAPVISDFMLSNVTESSVQVGWLTDEPATTILYYGASVPRDSMVQAAMTLDHTVRLSGLSPSTLYYLLPAAVDSEGLYGFGPDTSVVTAALLRISIADTSLAIGDTLRLPIRVDQAQDLAALQYYLQFSSSRVEIVDLREGPFYTDNGGFAFFREIRNGAGRLANHLTWNIVFEDTERTGTNADGGGIVAFALLRGVDAGIVQATFSADSSFGLDMFANVRACSLRAGTITIRP